jgi:DNA-binding helix-hairpin-helix protein with protein kinase domain
MMNQREQLEKRLKEKQTILNNKSLIDKLPDKGERVKLQIEDIQRQLNNLNTPKVEKEQPQKQLTARQREKLPMNSNGDFEVNELGALLSRATITSEEQQRAHDLKMLNEVSQHVNYTKTISELEEEIKHIQGKRGVHLYQNKRIQIISLEESTKIAIKDRYRLLDEHEEPVRIEKENDIVDYDNVDD